MELIEREAVLGYMKGWKGETVEYVRKLPAIDAVPVVHGRWKAAKAGGPNYPFWDSRCSECWYTTSSVIRNWNYCPVCGAKMDLKEEEHADGA